MSAQRRQSIHLLNIECMAKDDATYVCTLNKHIKQSRPGYTPPRIEFNAFPDNPNICVVSTQREYINRTDGYRGDISRWLKLVLVEPGINTSLFKAPSTRCAAVSKANANGLHIDDTLKTAGWSSECTFAKFYNKPIDKKEVFCLYSITRQQGLMLCVHILINEFVVFVFICVCLSFKISWEPAMRVTRWNLEIKRDLPGS